MSGRIDALLEHARDRIRAWLPELAECEVHDGRIDGPEAERVAIRAPAVRVALLDAREVEPCRYPEPGDDAGFGGSLGAAHATLRLAACAVCEDRDRGTSGWKHARAICERVAVGIATDPWELGFPRERPSEIRITSLFSAGQDRSGTALMAVAWEQAIEIEEPGGSGPDRPLPRELYRGQAPETGAGHAGSYDELYPGAPGPELPRP